MSRKERRRLVRELQKAEWAIWDMEVMFGGSLTGGRSRAVYPWGRKQRDKFRNLLEQYDSRKLEKQAERWGIDLPVKPEWFSTEIKTLDPATVEDGRDTVIDRWLNETGRTMIERQIKDARFAYWKRWADILVPILALIVAILAILKR